MSFLAEWRLAVPRLNLVRSEIELVLVSLVRRVHDFISRAMRCWRVDLCIYVSLAGMQLGKAHGVLPHALFAFRFPEEVGA